MVPMRNIYSLSMNMVYSVLNYINFYLRLVEKRLNYINILERVFIPP